MADKPWWVADMEREIARDQAAIEGKADWEMVRLPVGDARPEPVRDIKARIAEKQNAIEIEARGMRVEPDGKILYRK